MYEPEGSEDEAANDQAGEANDHEQPCNGGGHAMTPLLVAVPEERLWYNSAFPFFAVSAADEKRSRVLAHPAFPMGCASCRCRQRELVRSGCCGWRGGLQ